MRQVRRESKAGISYCTQKPLLQKIRRQMLNHKVREKSHGERERRGERERQRQRQRQRDRERQRHRERERVNKCMSERASLGSE